MTYPQIPPPGSSPSARDWQEYIFGWSLRKGWYDCKTCKGSGKVPIPSGDNDCSSVYVEIDCDKCEDRGGRRVAKRSVPEAIALIHSELSEALEFYRHANYSFGLGEVIYKSSGNEYTNRPEYAVDSKPDGFGIELADCVIRILDTAEYLGIDIQEMIRVKMAHNEDRPHRHGGKAC